jgi:DNA replication protein DnaC
MREYTTQQADDLYELISDRTRAGSIIVTSNRPPQDWYALFPNPVLAEGALDRLLGRAHHVVLQGRSYHQFQRPDRAKANNRGVHVTAPVCVRPAGAHPQQFAL